MTEYRSARVEEYMRLWSHGADDERLDALLRPMDALELYTLAKRLNPDKRTVSTPGEFTAKAACVLIGYWMVSGIVSPIVRVGYVLLFGDHHEAAMAARIASAAAVLGIIYVGLVYEERERERRSRSEFDYLKDRQRQARERMKAPEASQTP